MRNLGFGLKFFFQCFKHLHSYHSGAFSESSQYIDRCFAQSRYISSALIAVTAKNPQIFYVIGAALAQWNDVIYVQAHFFSRVKIIVIM